MLAYKGFHKDLTCTLGKGRYQYRENEWHEEAKANCMSNGYHCAENPLDCLTYYGNWDESAYYLVEAGGDIDEDGADSKISCTRIKLMKRLDIYDFIAVAVEYICNHPERRIKAVNTTKIQVARDMGKARENGGVIVYGEAPRATGPVGSVIALVKIRQGELISISIQRIDGKKYKPDRWYGI